MVSPVSPTKRLLPVDSPSADVGGRIDAASSEPLLKKLKVEETQHLSDTIISAANSLATSSKTSSSPHSIHQSSELRKACDTDTSSIHSDAPLTSTTGLKNSLGVNGTRLPINGVSAQKGVASPAMTAESGSTVTGTVTASVISHRLLSSNICDSARDRDRSESLSVSTLSSSDSTGKKETITPSAAASLSFPAGIVASQPSTTSCDSNTYTHANATIVPSAKNSVTSGLSPSPLLPPQTPGMGPKKLSPPPPLKSTKMAHLRKKYMEQLEYMHREFKKLERQLLGAKSSSKSIIESAGSKERREKLHSFIVHLEETMNQIQVGCELEVEGKSTLGVAVTSSGGAMISGGDATSKDVASAHSIASDPSSTQERHEAILALAVEEEEAKKEFARSSALTKVTKEKEEEENVQKLEEHILANLLPVKERLTKQLAAQQGAAKNPVGMPPRRGLQPPSAAPPQGRPVSVKQERVPNFSNPSHGPLNPPSVGPVTGPTIHSQFGQPLKGGGSSLTQKLHGKTLGSQQRPQGHGVGIGGGVKDEIPAPSTTTPRKVVYAGLTPGSRQVHSGVSAALGVHDMIVESSRHQTENCVASSPQNTAAPPPPPSIVIKVPAAKPRTLGPAASVAPAVAKPVYSVAQVATDKSRVVPLSTLSYSIDVVKDSEALKKGRKVEKRRVDQERQRQIILHHQQQQIQRQQAATAARRVVKSSPGAIRSASNQKKGPRSVEYICALCNESYKSTCEHNPWWALSSHECVKCGKTQIPRLDISAPANAIEYHPALLAHATTDDSKGTNKVVSVASHPASQIICGQDVRKTGEFSHKFVDIMEGFESDSDDSDYDENTPSARAENEDFGKNYSGPKFTDYDASRLLTLMSHASTCPGRHTNKDVRDCCANVKYMMLHVRDCPGTTPGYDICPYPWCRKVKHLLYHLVSCPSPAICKICSPVDISDNLRALRGLNNHRSQKRRDLCVGHCPVHHEPGKAAEGGLELNVATKKSAPLKKVPRNGVVSSETRTIRNTKLMQLTKHPALVGAHNGPTKKCASTVPSPIPAVGQSTIKHSNPLLVVQAQAQAALLKSQHHSLTKPSTNPVPKSIVGSVNEKSALHSTSTYLTQKTSSPPNPLKRLPSDHSVAPSTNFPTLPSHVLVHEDNDNVPSQDHHGVMRNGQLKIKVEGISK